MNSTLKNLQLGDKQVKCKFCKALLPHNLALKLHLKKRHKKIFKYKCDLCTERKTFISPSGLRVHIKVHHEEKGRKAKCKYCGKVVAHRLYMHCHLRVCPKRSSIKGKVCKKRKVRKKNENKAVLIEK